MKDAKLILVALVSALTGAAAMGAFVIWYIDPFSAHSERIAPPSGQEADIAYQGASSESNSADANATEAYPPLPADEAIAPAGEREVPASAFKLKMPVKGVDRDELVDSFGDPRGGGDRRHEGIDIMAPLGTPVVAVTDATVSDIFDSEAGGLTLTIRGDDVAYFYGHLSAYARGLTEGEHVRRGERLGYVGATGNADASAPHLHFEMRLLSSGERWSEGQVVNPYPYLRRR